MGEYCWKWKSDTFSYLYTGIGDDPKRERKKLKTRLVGGLGEMRNWRDWMKIR